MADNDQSSTPGPGLSAKGLLRLALPLVPLAIALIHTAVTANRAAPPSVVPPPLGAVAPAPAVPPPPPPQAMPMAPPLPVEPTIEAGRVGVPSPLPGERPLPPCGAAGAPACTTPYPMLAKGHPVSWWFVFKLNAAKFPKCGTPASGGAGTDGRSCPFGGTVQMTASYKNFGQRFVYASAEAPALADGGQTCLGTNTDDPVGATFDEIYNGKFHYVVWNDQFYQSPQIPACGKDDCPKPWGHSKGILAWNDAGEGLVMQVSTPSWPGSGSAKFPRTGDGNTLGCVVDNDILVSQHFFALRLSRKDLLEVLAGLSNASIGTDPKIAQIVNNGGPPEIQAAVSLLGVRTTGIKVVSGSLSTGVTFIAKPSNLNVPPWQMVSAVLGGVPLRTATWWASPYIASTTSAYKPSCWNDSVLGRPGAVEVATTGHWDGVEFSLQGGPGTNYNHAKIGVSTTPYDHYSIFGDMNQQGTLVPSATGFCDSSQNGRGGTFYVVKNAQLSDSIAKLIAGDTAPAAK